MKVAFIDRDGTLIVGPKLLQEEPPLYDEIIRIDQLQILPGVYEGLNELSDAGYTLVMVTNQKGLGSETFPLKGFEHVQRDLLRRLEKRNIRFERIFICPHLPSEECSCRKPNTGLVDVFIQEQEIDLDASLMIGDEKTDEEFSRRIGANFIKAASNKRFPANEIRQFLSNSSS